jgi:autoinducer 2-degrading protein
LDLDQAELKPSQAPWAGSTGDRQSEVVEAENQNAPSLTAVAGIVIFTRLRAAPGRVDDLRAAFEPLHEAASGEPGTLAFAVHVANDDPNLILCYEVYADDAALDRHRTSTAVRGAVSAFGELLDGTPEVTYTRLLTGKGVPLA